MRYWIVLAVAVCLVAATHIFRVVMGAKIEEWISEGMPLSLVQRLLVFTSRNSAPVAHAAVLLSFGIADFSEVEMSEKAALRRIRIAWVAGVALGIISFLMATVKLTGLIVLRRSIEVPLGLPLLSWALMSYIGAAFYLGFSYGIHRKSRFCAIGVFVSWLVICIPYGLLLGKVWWTYVLTTIAILFYLGVKGTWAYQRLRVRQALS